MTLARQAFGDQREGVGNDDGRGQAAKNPQRHRYFKGGRERDAQAVQREQEQGDQQESTPSDAV